MITLTVTGAESDDYSNAALVSESGSGHTLSYLIRGTFQFMFHAMAGQWVESGGSGQTTTTDYVIDGVHQPDYTSSAVPASGTYSCSGSTLTLVQSAGAPGSGGFPSTAIYTKVG